MIRTVRKFSRLRLPHSIRISLVLGAALLLGVFWVLVVRAGAPTRQIRFIDNGSSPIPIVSDPANQHQHVMTTDGAGGAIVAWTDTRVPPTDTVPVWWEQETVIYAQRVLSTGGVLWALDGVPVVDLTRPISEVFYLHSQPAVAADGVGGTLIGFLNDAGEFPGVYVQRLNAQGEMVWRDRYRYGHEIANKDENLMDILVMAGDGVEGAIVVWGLYTDKGGRLYAQRVGKYGDKVWESSVPLFTNFQNDTDFEPQVVPDGLGGVIIVWRDYRSGVNPGIYAQRLNKDGNRLWGVDGVPVAVIASDDGYFKPQVAVAADGSGGAFITWDSQIAGQTRVYAQYLDENGAHHWPASVLLSDHTEPNTTVKSSDPAIARDGSGGVFVVWRRHSPVSVRAHRVSSDGVLLWGESDTRGVNLSSDSAYSGAENITAVSDNEGGAFVAWECSYSDGTNLHHSLCVQHLHNSGVVLCGAAGVQIAPIREPSTGLDLVSSHTQGVIAAWKDLPEGSSTGQTDIYAQLAGPFCAGEWQGEADVMLRDNGGDSGAVPSSPPWWASPDVWVRNTGDGIEEHQDPLEGQENTVYVRVSNRGNMTAEDVAVVVYYGAPGLALVWPDDWIEIVSATIATLDPGSSHIAALPWTPPSAGPANLLVQVAAQDDPVTSVGDVPGDNNIAQLNVDIIRLGAEDDPLSTADRLVSSDELGSDQTSFLVSNPLSESVAADVVIELDALATGGSLSLELVPDLFDRWQAAGGVLQGAEVTAGATGISVTSPISAAIIGLPLEPGEDSLITATVKAPPTDSNWLYIELWERIAGGAVGGLVLRAPVTYDLTGSAKTASALEVAQGAVVTYTITLTNQGNQDHPAVALLDALPPSLTYVSGSLAWSAGQGVVAQGTVSWTGPVSLTQLTTVTYQARVDALAAPGGVLTNTVAVNDGYNPTLLRQAVIEVLKAPWIKLVLPMVFKNQ
jgi:uncharacterized repeat protein (TIGR01451 family)